MNKLTYEWANILSLSVDSFLNYLNHINVRKLPALLSRGCHLVLNIYTEP
jgi:hypothetical protein